MRILIVWRGIPNPLNPSFARPYYFIKNYANKCSMTLLAPNIVLSHAEKYRDELKGLTDFKEVEVYYPKSMIGKIAKSLINRLSYTNLTATKDFNFSKLYFYELTKAIKRLLKEEKFDVVYLDYMVINHIQELLEATILEFFSPTLYTQKILWKYGTWSIKLPSVLRYFLFRYFESNRYKSFDAGIYVTKTHFELSKPFVPKKAFIIPPGVDLNYFKPSESQEEEKLVFTGGMGYPVNVISVLNFCKKIYPMIKKEIPKVKFYIVGRSPSNEILRLAKLDSSITVTGAVEDVRPYVWSSAVFVVPIVVDDGGIKTKTLEAMAMGKAIVSSPLGAQDIGCENGKHLIIADNEKEFAERVVELIGDERERRRLGKNARKFVEENYSWDKKSEELYRAMLEVIEGR